MEDGRRMTYDHLIDFLGSDVDNQNVVILPDFFLDHFVVLDDFDSFTSGIERLATQGGGNLMGTNHLIRRGGNSVNTASALLRLGLDPTLIVTTDEQGSLLLKSLVDPSLDLSHVHTDGKLAATVSIELEYQARPVNLMVSDSGSVANFSFDDLTEDDILSIRESTLTALLCLNHNKNGSALAKDLFSMLKSDGSTITFMDTGDPSGNPSLISSLTKDVLGDGLVDILGANENEISWFAAAISNDSNRWKPGRLEQHDWLRAAKLVSSEIGVRVDLHTPLFSACIIEDHLAAVPSFEMTPRLTCGAGDSWNAGDIYGSLYGLSDVDRLTMANALAALYVSSENAEHPTKNQIIHFLEEKPQVSVSGKNLLKSQCAD